MLGYAEPGGMAKSHSLGIRPDWLYCAVRECQVLAGVIAMSDEARLNVRARLCATIPPVANTLEHLVLEGLIAQSQRAIEHATSHSIAARTRSGVAAKAAYILRTRYTEHWTISRLARELGTNRFHLTTEFRQTHGCGVHHYLIRSRVDAAGRLIGGGVKIEAAAYAVGFHSKKTLYSTFRKIRGTAPSSARGAEPPD
jgi:AraC-like DNA-binding protein